MDASMEYALALLFRVHLLFSSLLQHLSRLCFRMAYRESWRFVRIAGNQSLLVFDEGIQVGRCGNDALVQGLQLLNNYSSLQLKFNHERTRGGIDVQSLVKGPRLLASQASL